MTYHILWIDDEPATMRAVHLRLQMEGFHMTRCATTTEAIHQYSTNRYDLIMLDRMMPPGDAFESGDGFEMVDTGNRIYSDLRERTHLETVPIIIYTQYFDPGFAREITAKDSLAKVIAKDVVGDDLIQELLGMIRAVPARTVAPEVPDPG